METSTTRQGTSSHKRVNNRKRKVAVATVAAVVLTSGVLLPAAFATGTSRVPSSASSPAAACVGRTLAASLATPPAPAPAAAPAPAPKAPPGAALDNVLKGITSLTRVIGLINALGGLLRLGAGMMGPMMGAGMMGPMMMMSSDGGACPSATADCSPGGDTTAQGSAAGGDQQPAPAPSGCASDSAPAPSDTGEAN